MIKKHGSLYWLDIRVDGKRVRRSLKTGEQGLALERAREIERELRTPKGPGVELGTFLDRYLEWTRATKPASLRTEKPQIEFIRIWFRAAGVRTLGEISLPLVERFRAAVLAGDRRFKDGKPHEASRATANRYCALLRIVFNRARAWGVHTGTNPAAQLKFFPERGRRRPPTDAEVGKILAAAEELARRKHATPLQREGPALVRFVTNTGLRRSEALMLRWADVGDDEITIRGKGAKSRSIPLNEEARMVLASRVRGGAYVFDIPGRQGDSLMRRYAATIEAKSGVPFGMHALRHYFASKLLAAGVDVVTISQLLGHSAYMTTLLYAHSSPRLMKEAVDTLTGHRTHLSKRAKAKKPL